MRRIKPVYISILTIVLFAIGMFFGVKSDWWILEGRKTPLDAPKTDEHAYESTDGEQITEDYEDHDDEEHEEKTEISGSTTVQDAYDLGITKQQLEDALQGAVDNPDKVIKEIVEERGLGFGKVKEELNGIIGK